MLVEIVRDRSAGWRERLQLWLLGVASSHHTSRYCGSVQSKQRAALRRVIESWGSCPNIPSNTFTVKLYDMLTAIQAAGIIAYQTPSSFVLRRAISQLLPVIRPARTHADEIAARDAGRPGGSQPYGLYSGSSAEAWQLSPARNPARSRSG